MISVVLATYNEEKNLNSCLNAIKDWVDEIVIVDGSSTDQTTAIAKKFDAKVYITTNKPNFHINKQMAMDKAGGELVLQLDADEIVDEELKNLILQLHQQIKKTKKTADFSPKAWWIKRKNFFLGRWLSKGGQYPDQVIRLYINGFAKLPQQDVHEQMTVDGETAIATGHLLHYSNPNFSSYVRKFNAYTDLKATQLKEAGLKINLLSSFKYLIYLPAYTFLSLFIRHKGFVDGLAGFVFALFSGLYHCIAYLKLWEIYAKGK